MVKVVECPRCAWQDFSGSMPAEIKADYLSVLIAAGFKTIDAISFAPQRTLAQVREPELVLEYLDPPDDVEVIALVADEKGAQRALKSGAISVLAYPYSLSPKFHEERQSQTLEEALDGLEAVGTLAYRAGADVVAYVSMAFGNPFGEPWSIDEAVAACDLLADSGVTQVSLIDNAGFATPRLLGDLLSDVLAVNDRLEVGVHLFPQPQRAEELVRTAYAAGCRRFDGVIGGYGTSAEANDVSSAPLATETLLRVLKELGAELPELQPLESIQQAAAEIQARYGRRTQ